MDRRITFYRKVFGSNSTNEDEITSWEKLPSNHTVWSKVDQKPGRELVVADTIQSVINTTFVIDYRTDLTEAMRAVLDTKVFNMISISEHEGTRKTYLLIQAESIPNLTWIE
jgi:SPP1 family predicted phage head-tail adaptor